MSTKEETKEEEKAPPSVLVAIVVTFVGMSIFMPTGNYVWLILGIGCGTAVRFAPLLSTRFY